jgi:lipopolysaccharide/colanic/teichoic acid biosynthesis glycosyltransferase
MTATSTASAPDQPHVGAAPVGPTAAAPPAGDDRARSALELVPWLARYPRRSPPPGRAYRTVKRLLDVTVVAALSPLWAPVYAVCAAAVKIGSPGGPVLFSQPRTGLDGRRFRVHKLRTMVPDAEDRKAELAHLNERTWPDFKITDDPRVTRVGKFLRSTSLDEVPQVLNVASGELSLVGPRPWSKGMDAHERDWEVGRYAVPAGLTGLWQISARDAGSFTERVRLDLAYLQRRCLRLDLEILLRTIPAVLRRRGAS